MSESSHSDEACRGTKSLVGSLFVRIVVCVGCMGLQPTSGGECKMCISSVSGENLVSTWTVFCKANLRTETPHIFF